MTHHIERWAVRLPSTEKGKPHMYLWINDSGMFGWSTHLAKRYSCKAAAERAARRYHGIAVRVAVYEVEDEKVGHVVK